MKSEENQGKYKTPRAFGSSPTKREERPGTPIRLKLYKIIFEAETPLGKAFDISLLVAILVSVIAVMLESVSGVQKEYGKLLTAVEWVFTILFTVEYLFRLFCVRRPHLYAFSFYGIIDLLAVLPTYLSLVFAGTHMLLVIRIIRLFRVFRVLKLTRYVGEANMLSTALKASRFKIIVFLESVLVVVVLMGALMYLIEGSEAGFTSIPKGVYWAIVTMTTVGYGDIAPQTVLGQSIAALVMILGYGIIAVPTGIVSVELANASRLAHEKRACAACLKKGHDADAEFCKFCGSRL